MTTQELGDVPKKILGDRYQVQQQLDVIEDHCGKYMRLSKPIHLTQRVNDNAYSIVNQYQAEYRGVIQYYRMAYNLVRVGETKTNHGTLAG